MSPLRIEHISKSFHNHKVLDDISLTLNEGEIFGLIGLNGIGKTTLIKIILGLLSEDAGDISLFDTAWKKIAAKKHLSYLPEKFQPSRLLTGRECLDLSMSYYDKPYVHEVACQEAEQLGLDPQALDRRVSSYSKGMGQKIGLIASLMVDTPLLILDEPMSGLDPKARIQLKTRLNKARKEGKTIFFSSHILADIEEICDRIAILHNATFQFLGTTASFKERYKNMSLEQAFLEVIGEKAIQKESA
jgi:ABC-2 type transport system ATP-binding protein